MNVNVEADSLGFVASVNEHFGMPTTTSVDLPEFIGDYCVDGYSGFLIYEPRSRSWRHCEFKPRKDDDLMMLSHETAQGRADLWQMLELLGMLPRPPLPADASEKIVHEPFVHEGQRLAWVFVPELRRWELAPLGNA